MNHIKAASGPCLLSLGVYFMLVSSKYALNQDIPRVITCKVLLLEKFIL